MIHSAPSFVAAAGPSQYQYAQPFHLPDVATIGSRRISGTKARVYWLLFLTAERGYSHPIGQQMGPAGWVPRFLVVEPWSGGAQGDRRLRSLREDGVEIGLRFFENSTTTLYRYLGQGSAPAPGPSPTPSEAKKTTPTADALREPLRGVEVRVGHEGGGTGSKCLFCPARTVEEISNRVGRLSIDVTPGIGSPIAPSGQIGDDAYLAELRHRWNTGELVAAFRGGAFVTARVSRMWCPLPALAKALRAMGASVVFEGEG